MKRTERKGRNAKIALRAAPISDEINPIKPGLSGGSYKPLSENDVKKLYNLALDALSEIGLGLAPQSGINYMTKAGALLGDDGRIRFPKSLVEDMIALSSKELTLFGREEKFDMHLSGKKVFFGTAGAAVHVVDIEKKEYRDSTAQDLYHAAQITQELDNIHFFQRVMVARDITDNSEMDLNTLYACCGGTTKHVGTSFSDPAHVKDCMDLLHVIAGGEERWGIDGEAR